MINAVNEQFSRFVNFAQERFDAGKTKAIATKGDISADASPLVGKVKFTATMTIKNASDAELGNGMPEFTIDDFTQVES